MAKNRAIAKLIAGRIQQAVDDYREISGDLSQTAFYKNLKSENRSALASAIRGWLPPPRKWDWNRESQEWTPKLDSRGRAPTRSQQATDWEAVRAPRADLIRSFCEYTSASADCILFGEGNPIRGQSQTKAKLADELAVHISRRVAVRARAKLWGGPHANAAFYPVDGEELIDDLVTNECAKHKKEWKRQYKYLNADDLPPQEKLGKLVKRYGNIAINNRVAARGRIIPATAESGKKRSTRHRKTPSNKAN
jgi:hypothetical protein